MRAFIGIELNPEWTRALASAGRFIRDAETAWRSEKWVRAENLHVTLKFLGDISESTGIELAEDLKELLAVISPFELHPEALVKPIPNAKRATMLWCTFRDPEGKCGHLAAEVERSANAYGIPLDERPYVPHVTLVRARGRKSSVRSNDAAAIAASMLLEQNVQSMSVRTVTLFRSELKRTGPRYERLAVCTLGN